jgi:methylated-DNA-[protein]-cysteine S-methyltransferase
MKTYTLIDADGVARPSVTPGTFGGHRGSRIYGHLDCAGAARAIARGGYVRSRVFFADEATAIAAGYRPCATCLPERYADWKARADAPLAHRVVTSPIGDVLVLATADDEICEIRFDATDIPDRSVARDDGVLARAAEQLAQYTAGARTAFDLPLAPLGASGWQRRVWTLLHTVPYGTTTTYGTLAQRLGAGTSARAVGSANATNPIPIVVPCHRVIGASGALTGYAGGLDRKRCLLEHEGALLPTG